ncbi:hypothetical protein RclHR1_03910006 [Rhizophagus clarus]|uniref:Uncharacterized protein n=1 Tax=Rhizophagus clarus TaxID=94130 RepID=A0A2Z6S8H3_9GLOM|nr:hypothetical protein RclHR1_03910006 [Rhizophagus clarus]
MSLLVNLKKLSRKKEKAPKFDNSFAFHSLEEALSCIPPSVTYFPGCITSNTTTKANGVQLKFEVRVAIDVNMHGLEGTQLVFPILRFYLGLDDRSEEETRFVRD